MNWGFFTEYSNACICTPRFGDLFSHLLLSSPLIPADPSQPAQGYTLHFAPVIPSSDIRNPTNCESYSIEVDVYCSPLAQQATLISAKEILGGCGYVASILAASACSPSCPAGLSISTTDGFCTQSSPSPPSPPPNPPSPDAGPSPGLVAFLVLGSLYLAGVSVVAVVRHRSEGGSLQLACVHSCCFCCIAARRQWLGSSGEGGSSSYMGFSHDRADGDMTRSSSYQST